MSPRSSIWYFPGDPPFFETLGTLALLLIGALAALGGLALWMTSLTPLRRFRARTIRVLMVFLSLLLLPLGISALGIGRRHFGEWAALKALIDHHSRVVAVEVSRSGGGIQLSTIEMRNLDPLPTFRFSAFPEPIHLRIMQSTPPYIGVDFGDGANAVFDPVTMICTYAD